MHFVEYTSQKYMIQYHRVDFKVELCDKQPTCGSSNKRAMHLFTNLTDSPFVNIRTEAVKHIFKKTGMRLGIKLAFFHLFFFCLFIFSHLKHWTSTGSGVARSCSWLNFPSRKTGTSVMYDPKTPKKCMLLYVHVSWMTAPRYFRTHSPILF